MTENKKVSVILPTFNGAKFIDRAISSVLNQTFRNLEILVVDDGSSDNTFEVVLNFSKQDARVIYLKNEKNLGIQRSLNLALKSSKNEYIARIDDDDEWIDKEKLEKQINFLNENQDYFLVGTGTIVVDENRKELFRFLNPKTNDEIRRSLLKRNCFTHSSVLFRKESVLKLGGYSETEETLHVEDYDLWLRLGKFGKQANLSDYSVTFMNREKAISSQNRLKQFKKNIQLIKKYRSDYPGYKSALIIGYVRLIFYKILYLPILNYFKNSVIKFYKEFIY